jgi:hypothetical protein
MRSNTLFTRSAMGVVLLLLTAAPTYADVPTVTSISPNRGTTAGGTLVTINGTSLTGTTSVTFDNIAGTSLTVLSDTALTVRTPAHALGVVDVKVTNADGSNTLNEAFGFGNIPSSLDDEFNAAFNTALQIFPPGVLSNDNTSDGGDMTAVLVSEPATGNVSLSSDGGFLYTPPAGFSGTATFTYRATNGAGTGNLATVRIVVSQPTGPLPPVGLFVAAVSGNTVTLRWTISAFGAVPTNHLLEGGTAPGLVQGALVTGSAAPVFTFTAPSGILFLRVRALAGADQSAPSNEVRVAVNVLDVPTAPDNLLGLVNGSGLALAWRNTLGGGAPTSIVLDVTGSIVTSLTLPVGETFTFGGVPPGTYTFTVRAVNATGSSAPSGPVTLTFPGACSGPPLTPTSFAASKSGTTLDVSWGLPASGPAPTGYILNVGGTIVGTFPSTSRQMSANVGTGTFTVSVIAINACGASAPTATQTVTIP